MATITVFDGVPDGDKPAQVQAIVRRCAWCGNVITPGTAAHHVRINGRLALCETQPQPHRPATMTP